MDISYFIERIEDEFEDIKPGLLTPGSDYKKILEWSSVNALIMISLIDAEFEVILNANDLNKTNTISELYKLIEKKKIS
ncbi:MAG: acyl carrier protein [Bacteroidales bacterium]